MQFSCSKSLFLLVLCLSAFCTQLSSGLTYDVDFINPTYMQFTVSGTGSEAVVAVDIAIYDWDSNSDLLHPNKVWMPLTLTERMFVFSNSGETNRKYGSLWLPASLRVHSSTGNDTDVFVDANIITDMAPKIYTSSCTVSSCPDLTNPPDDGLPLASGGVYRGITVWDANAASDACMLESTGDSIQAPYLEYHVAVSEHMYGDGGYCGECIAVRSSLHTEWIEALVIDSCPANFPDIPYPNVCARLNWLDVSPAVFRDLTNNHCGHYGAEDWGYMQMEYKFVPCSGYSGTKLHYQVKKNSGSGWFAIQVRRHVDGVTSLDIRTTGSTYWTPLIRQDYNFFEGCGLTCSPTCDLKITSVANETLIDLAVLPTWTGVQTTYQGTVQFSAQADKKENEEPSSATHCLVTTLVLILSLLL